MAFCWLPPESVPIRVSGVRAFIASVLISRSAAVFSFAADGSCSAGAIRNFCRAARVTFHATGNCSIALCVLRSSGTRAIPCVQACRGEVMRTRLPPISCDTSGFEDAPMIWCRISLRPAPASPANPTISPRLTLRLRGGRPGKGTSPSAFSAGAPPLLAGGAAGVLSFRAGRPEISSTREASSRPTVLRLLTRRPSRITDTLVVSCSTSSAGARHRRWQPRRPASAE